jgi:hypothetical protein
MSRSLTLLLLLAVPAISLAQGKLDQVRDAVDRTSPPAARDNDRNNCDDSSGSGGSSSSTSSSGEGSDSSLNPFYAAIFAPWGLPHMAWDLGTNVGIRFPPYPYSEPANSYLVLDRPRDGARSYFDRTDTQWWAVRASAEAGSDFDGLDRVGLRLFLDTETRVGMKTDWDYYSEKQPCGCRDSLWIGDLTATYRFVQNERLLMHTGAGARFLVDHGNDRAGFNFLYGFEAFPVEPVHLFGSFEAGTLGHADVIRLRGGVGVNWTHFELFAGYDFLRIGGVNLQGPMAGLRVWF